MKAKYVISAKKNIEEMKKEESGEEMKRRKMKSKYEIIEERNEMKWRKMKIMKAKRNGGEEMANVKKKWHQ